MFPINTAALMQRMSGKGRLVEVQNGTGFMRTGRVASFITHFTDLKDGTYRSGETSPCVGEFSIATHFLKKDDCVRSIRIPLRMLWGIYDSVKSWRRTAGKEAREVVVNIKRDAPNSDWTSVTVYGEGKYGEWGALTRTFHINTEGQEFDTGYRFKVGELLDFLYVTDLVKEKDILVDLAYQEGTSLINDNPLFITFEAYDRTFCVGHQIVKELDVESEDDDDRDDESGAESFLDDDYDVKEEFESSAPDDGAAPAEAAAPDVAEAPPPKAPRVRQARTVRRDMELHEDQVPAK